MATSSQPNLFSFGDVFFSVKTFTAAMLALFVALCFDLQNPFWAVTTVYIVSNPLSGASTSKAVYRLLGTVIGGTMTVVLVPNLVNAPELLTFAISLWIAICLGISLLDRTPRSYVFMLAGYTAALTGFPIVATPELAFTNAAARVIEIGDGIICAALVSRIVFPRHAGTVLSARIETWLRTSSMLAANALRGRVSDASLSVKLMELAAEAVDLKSFTTHVAYDTSSHRDSVGLARLLQRRMVVLLPIMSALSETLSTLYQIVQPKELPELSAAIEKTSAWMESEVPLSSEGAGDMRRTLDGAKAEVEQLPYAERAIGEYFVTRLRDLIQIWSDCNSLKEDLVSGSRQKLRWARFGISSPTSAKHNDYRMAIQSGLAAMISTCLATAFWIYSAWPQGSAAAMMAGVLCCIFATLDDPTPAMKGFLYSSVVAIAGSMVMEFALLSAVDGFFPMVAALGLFLIPSGVVMARPKTAIAGLGFSMLLPTMITLQDRLDPNFESFVNSNVAIVVGFIIACCSTAIVRSVGAEWSARRLLLAGYADIATTARMGRAVVHDGLPHRMVDRLGLIAPRVARLPKDVSFPRVEILRDVRDAFNIVEVRHNIPMLASSQREKAESILVAFADRYDAYRHLLPAIPEGDLVVRIDELVTDLFRSPGEQSHDALRIALTGLHQNLISRARTALVEKPQSPQDTQARSFAA